MTPPWLPLRFPPSNQHSLLLISPLALDPPQGIPPLMTPPWLPLRFPPSNQHSLLLISPLALDPPQGIPPLMTPPWLLLISPLTTPLSSEPTTGNPTTPFRPGEDSVVTP